jgi:hypothetical protein
MTQSNGPTATAIARSMNGIITVQIAVLISFRRPKDCFLLSIRRRSGEQHSLKRIIAGLYESFANTG